MTILNPCKNNVLMDVDVSRLSQELLFSKEAAAYLGISVQRLMKLTKDGKIKPLKKNASGTIYHISELDARKKELSIFDEFWESSTNMEIMAFDLSSATCREALNFAIVMNILKVSEKRASLLFDSLPQELVSSYMSDSFLDWASVLKVNEDELRRAYDFAFSKFSYLKKGDGIIKRGDIDYPEMLLATEEAPRFLYVRGNKTLLHDNRTVALVGSRMASDEGKDNTRRVAENLGRNGIIIVSGLAKGIDVVAHKTALSKGYNTIAVIGTNINQYYPAENKDVQLEIEEKGLVVSQFSPATKTERWFFPLRDGVMSGLSQATVIMEAGETSGALKQATFALKQKRLVLIPQNAFLIKSITWPAKLVEKGAICVKSPKEIIDQLSRKKVFKKKEYEENLDLFDLNLNDIVVCDNEEN